MSYSYESYSYSTQEFVSNDVPTGSSGAASISYSNNDSSSYAANESISHDNYAYGSSTATSSDLANLSTTQVIINDLVRMMSNSRTNSNVYSVEPTTSSTPFDLYRPDSSLDYSNRYHLSSIETSMLRSNVPIDLTETEEITVNGQRGIWANKMEELNWRGPIPIGKYPINDDRNPEVITKKISQQLEYVQELAIRYLRPPTPPLPGEIIITQEANKLTPPAPPLIIRQQPPRPPTPEPLIIRESPPKAPPALGRKMITISGRRLPPPPRKVVIERLAPLPSKPQSVIVERWLPYNDNLKRKVIFQRAPADPVIHKPKNIIIQWEAPQVVVKKDFKYLGTIRANPVEYVQRYGSTLKTAQELPQFVLDIKPPNGITLASEYNYNSVHELEGDVDALRLVDLEREGLGEYKSQVQNYLSNANYSLNESYLNTSVNESGLNGSYTTASSQFFTPNALSTIEQIFSTIDIDSNGNISVGEAEKILLRLNSRLNRNYGENEVAHFFHSLDSNRDGNINLNEFKAAFQRLLY